MNSIGIFGAGRVGCHVAKMLLKEPKTILNPSGKPYRSHISSESNKTVFYAVRNYEEQCKVMELETSVKSLKVFYGLKNHEEGIKNFQDLGSVLTLVWDNHRVAEKSDLVILSTESYDVKDVCREIMPFLKGSTPIISTTMGVPLDVLHEWFPNTKTIIRLNSEFNLSSNLSLNSESLSYYSKSPDAADVMSKVFPSNKAYAKASDFDIDIGLFLSKYEE